jgi:CRISPR/Cas system-associated exonuclease Cas4 (RecB family)
MLKEFINQYYLDRHKDREQHHFYITDAGKCPRQVFFKFKNAPKRELEARILRLFEHGDYIHQLILRPLLSMRGIHVVASEINIPPQELISGRADIIISDGKGLYVVDIKSINSLAFNSLKEPKEDHVNQIQLYLHFLDPKKGILLYVSKDTQELKEFQVEYDQKKAKVLLAELTGLKTKIDTNVIPDRISEYPDNWQCKYCAFREICDLTGSGELSWEAFKKRIETQ